MVIKVIATTPKYSWREEQEHFDQKVTDYQYATYYAVKAGSTLHGTFDSIVEGISAATRLANLLEMANIPCDIEVIEHAKKA